MARRSSAQTHRGFHTGAVPSASTPTTCPVCGEPQERVKGQTPHQVLEAHLMAQHRPVSTCQHEHRSDGAPAWKLDWDAVLPATPLLWYCSECGFYLPAE